MTTTTLERDRATFGISHPVQRASRVTAFTVDLVDGNGLEVAGEPVTARFDLGNGYERVVAVPTDGSGRARFVHEHAIEPVTVTLSAGREIAGPLRPRPGARLTLEL